MSQTPEHLPGQPAACGDEENAALYSEAGDEAAVPESAEAEVAADDGPVDEAAVEAALDAAADASATHEFPFRRAAAKVREFPRTPGIYLMKDAAGRVIYVGKSACLRDRVGSYFQPSTRLDFKKAPMLEHVVDFDILEMDSEVEALLAENRLIKDIQPKFNARLLDDKTFPYLMVTTGDDYPGVYITREPRTQGVKLYGPFASAGTVSSFASCAIAATARTRSSVGIVWQARSSASLASMP